MRDSFTVLLVAAFFVTALAGALAPSVAAQPTGGLGQRPTRPLLNGLPEKLEGRDPHVGALAAHDLIQAIASTDPHTAGSRRAHLEFFMQCLDGAGLASKTADQVSAERIVTTLGTWIDDKGTFSDGVARDVLLPLLGVGDDPLRASVIRALSVNAIREGGKVELSSTLAALQERLLEAKPPPRTVIEDAARVLWKTDGKALLATLIEALARQEHVDNAEAFLVTQGFLKELHERLPMSLPTSAAWKEWWTQHEELELKEIFARALEHGHQQHVVDWKRQQEHLRATADAERVLLSIQDTLANSWGGGLRVAAVSELGDFAGWIRDTDVQTPEEADTAEFKERLLTKAVRTLISLQQRKLPQLESSAVLEEVLRALGAYQIFLDRAPDLKREVSEIVVASFEQLPLAVSFENNREHLLAALRLAGGLHVVQARPIVEELLLSPEKPWATDMELLTTSVAMLGSLLDEGSGDDWSRHLIQLFRQPRDASEEDVREFRRACVNALSEAAGHGVKSPEALTLLRSFYQELLQEGGERNLRIPGIIGLGTLARLQDPQALNILTNALGDSQQFELHELITIINSVAYVDPLLAFSKFLPHLADKDQKVQDHLWKTIVAIVETGGLPLLAKALAQLETVSYEEEFPTALQTAVRLCEEPQVKPLFLADNAGSAGERVRPLWEANLHLTHVYDQSGADAKRDAAIARLSGLEMRNPQIKETYPEGVAELQAFRQSLELRGAFDKKLKTPEFLDAFDPTKDIAPLLSADLPRGVFGGNLRWLYRRFTAMDRNPGLVRLVHLYAGFLESGAEDGAWEGFPPKFRERHVTRLGHFEEELRKASVEGGPGAKEPPAGGDQ